MSFNLLQRKTIYISSSQPSSAKLPLRAHDYLQHAKLHGCGLYQDGVVERQGGITLYNGVHCCHGKMSKPWLPLRMPA
jgi:hypothetical protein